MLSMVYDKSGSVVLPIGMIVGTETAIYTNTSPPGGVYFGYERTSIVTSMIEGRLLLDEHLVADLGLDVSYEGSMITSRWNYSHPTDGTAYVQVASLVGSKWESVLTQVRAHYENIVQPARLIEYDPSVTMLAEAHDTPGRVRKTNPPAGGGRWRWLPPLAPIIWDLLRDAVTPAPTPPPPARAPVPTQEQQIADCKATVNRAADVHVSQCASSSCPPAWRSSCTQCVQVQRDMQLRNCDLNLPLDGSGMVGCLLARCD